MRTTFKWWWSILFPEIDSTWSHCEFTKKLICFYMLHFVQPLVETCWDSGQNTQDCPNDLPLEGSATIMGYCYVCPGGVSFDMIIFRSSHCNHVRFPAKDLFVICTSDAQSRWEYSVLSIYNTFFKLEWKSHFMQQHFNGQPTRLEVNGTKDTDQTSTIGETATYLVQLLMNQDAFPKQCGMLFLLEAPVLSQVVMCLLSVALKMMIVLMVSHALLIHATWPQGHVRM